tara:strand:- start:204 stop:1166 length:963 start_codon:yes stop_codon:yes gene_type:complete
MAKKRLSFLESQRAKLKKQRALATTSKQRAIISKKIQQVTVRILDAKKQLTGSKTKGLLKAGQERITGSTNKGALPPGRTKPSGKPSARRAAAAAKQTRAAQGTSGSGVRTGQPAGAANRQYGATRVQQSVKRAQRSTALRGAARTGGRLAAQTVGFELASKLAQTVGKKDMPRMSMLGIQGPTKGASKGASNKQSGVSKKRQETLRKLNDAARRRKQEKARARKVGNPTEKTRAVYNKPKPAPKKSAGQVSTKTPPTTVTKPPKKAPYTKGKSTLQKEIEGTRKFIATHKDKKGAMQNAVKQARQRLERLMQKDPSHYV